MFYKEVKSSTFPDDYKFNKAVGIILEEYYLQAYNRED